MTQLDPRILAQIDVDPSATLSRVDGRWVLTLTRDLRHEPGRVWGMLTDPEQLARWSPIVPDRPLTSVGPAASREQPDAQPVDAEVLVTDPERELVHRWGSAQVRWVLTPLATGTRLEVHQTFDERSVAASYAAGWRVCLATLAATYDGDDVGRVVGPRSEDYGWQRLHDEYQQSLL